MNNVPFFIIGFPRSGTTLLRLLLNKHSRVCIPPESHFIPEIYRKLGDTFSIDDFVAALFNHHRYKDWKCDNGHLQKMLRQTTPEMGACFNTCFSEYAVSQGKSRWGDKTPAYIEHIGCINRLFPNSIIIHIIRDGRDVACSLQKVDWWNFPIAQTAKKWCGVVSRAQQDGNILGSSRYMEIRYEDLLMNPESNLRLICNHIDESFEPQMLSFYEDAMTHIVPKYHKYHPNINNPVNTRSVGQWQKIMTNEEVRVFEQLAGQLLHELNYQ